MFRKLKFRLIKLIFLCGARDFHAMDWYKSAKAILPGGDLAILTDLVQGEGYKKLIDQTDEVYRLVILDKFLFTNQGKFGHIWRDILKFSIFPVQVWKVKKSIFQKKPACSLFCSCDVLPCFAIGC